MIYLSQNLIKCVVWLKKRDTLGLVWYVLVWYGMVWYGLVWFGLVWFDVLMKTPGLYLVPEGDTLGLVWFGLVWFGMV